MPYELFQPTKGPGFLKAPQGWAYGRALGLVKDYFADVARMGIQQRFAGLAQEDALARIGAERGLPRGLEEGVDTYVDTLINAWEIWQNAGNNWAILSLLNFLGYDNAYVVQANGYVYGPSAGVVLPNPTAGIVGVPPSVTQGTPWLFAQGSRGFGAQGRQFPALASTTDMLLPWLPSSSVAAGQLITSNPTNGLAYQAGGLGTTGTSQPSFPIAVGGTVTDNGITWTCVGSMDLAPVGQSQGTVDALVGFWSAYQIVFDGLPATWTGVTNPPTPTSSPSSFEISTINTLLTLFGAAHASCAGCFVVFDSSDTRVTFGWPQGRTIYGDCGVTTATPAILHWVFDNAQSSGDIVLPTQGNGYWYQCTTPGTTDWVEPTWPTTPTDTVTDGTAVWTCMGTTNPTSSFGTSTVFAFEPTNPFD